MSVIVLASTYNGEKYIKEQLESLLSQSAPVEIYVRDDGSTDSTVDILKSYERQGKLSWYRGENLGAGKSFFDLCCTAPASDYYAFCDQDDVWDKDKIEAALAKLREAPSDKPALYFCAVRVVDADLNPIADATAQEPKISFGRALAGACATGCTMCFNRAAMDEFRKFKIDYIDIHDWALYRIVLALGGNVVYDPVAHISYRQHSSNAIGFEGFGINRWLARIKRLGKENHREVRSAFARNIKKIYYSRMDDKNKTIADEMANYKNSVAGKLKLICSKDVKMANNLDNLLFAVNVIIGRV